MIPGAINSSLRNRRMKYPEELEELFNDPLLAEVKPAPRTLTADDRLAEKLLCINEYIRRTGNPPSMTGDFEEKKLCRSLKALKNHPSVSSLKAYDEFNVLNIE